MDEWVRIGQQVLYLDADDRLPDGQVGQLDLPHDGRGVLTWYGPDGKESWAPPEDDFRLAWDADARVWGLWVRKGSDAAVRYDPAG